MVKMLGITPSRRARRFLVGLCVVTPLGYLLAACFALYPWREFSRVAGLAACINALVAIAMGMFLLSLLRRVFAPGSLEDLSERERDRVKVRQGQASRLWSRSEDERDAAMRREAEGQAFRLLKRGLPVFVAVYWVVCLSLPVSHVRPGLILSAVAVSGLMIVISALPEVIRMWMAPDGVGELMQAGPEK